MATGPSTRKLPPEALQRRLFVNAPPAAVWRALHDPARDGACYALATVGSASLDWPAAGARRSGQLRFGPVRLAVDVESLEARPAQRFRIGLAGAAMSGEARWDLVPAAGGTRVACALHLVGRSRLGRVLLRISRGSLPRRLEAELAALKVAAEAESSAA